MSDRRIEPDDDIRTRARERAYREFMAPGEAPDAREAAEAEKRLQTVLEREIGVKLGEVGAGLPPAPHLASPGAAALPGPPSRGVGAAGGARSGEIRGGSRRRGLFDVLLAPGWRPAFAAVLIVAAGALFYTSVLRRNEPPVMRGPGTVLQEGEIAVAAPELRPDGSLTLRWEAAREAERYAVVFLSPDLIEVARVEDLAGMALDLKAASLPAALTPGTDVLVRVVAMRGGDEVAKSRTMALTLPGR